MIRDEMLLAILIAVIGGLPLIRFYQDLNRVETGLFLVSIFSVSVFGLLIFANYFSKYGKEKQKRLDLIKELPNVLLEKAPDAICLGRESDLDVPIYIPDKMRSRHVHILGSTGSGKTESVILNFIKQDVARGYGCITLDAKGDASFLWTLKKLVTEDKLLVFDLSSDKSLSYDPLEVGNPLEAAQRLFSSLVWSEEYYKSKALTALQRLFQLHHQSFSKNPKLTDLSKYLEDPEEYAAFTSSETYPYKLAEKDFIELSGLRDQIKGLCTGHLEKILSPVDKGDIQLSEAANGKVIYFRLQSLLSPQLVGTLGRLLINHLNFLAGTAHREEPNAKGAKLIPTYLDEFASFACPEFADLISKARSAGFALHFSHQSIGDLVEVSKGFLNRITDNSATKIVMRINDPDSAEFFARSFGTKIYQKMTQRLTNTQDEDNAEVIGEGSSREAHQFRAAPDLFKTLPTGYGSVLIAHGLETPHGASSVFKIRFPAPEGDLTKG